ncbi:MAG TPA: DUF5946 family protein [Thermomicrobiales bacterium]|nr:DUF5946 family protein [Thermomicrobiales bacterium]
MDQSNAAQGRVRCIGCGALVPAVDGPAHRYIGASPGCWAAHGELLAKEYGEYRDLGTWQLVVDAYCAQHPGVPGPQSSQSVALHLMTLYLALERGATAEECRRSHQHMAHRGYPWLTPPDHRGDLTVADVLAARDAAEHRALVERWARAVWDAWAAHHATVRGWLGEEVRMTKYE